MINSLNKLPICFLGVFLIVYGCQFCLAPPPNTLFPQAGPPAPMIDVVDLRDADIDTKLAATTLLGHINKGEKTHVYVKLHDPNANAPDEFWLDYMKQKGYVRQMQNISVEEYFSKYRDHYKKVIVYDPDIPGSIHVAMMIGSLEEGIVINGNDVEQFGENKEVIDLRGRWASNVEAYEWAFENLWPKMNHDIICSLHPTFTMHYLRDYLVANKIFTYWITGKNAENGKVSSFEKEKAFAEKLFASSPANIPLIGWHGGGNQDHGINEYVGVRFAGQYGKLTYATDWGSNTTFISGVDIDIEKAIQAYHSRGSISCPSLEQDKVYLSFVIVDSGDAPIYWKYVQKKVWDDPKRGQIPIAWSLVPPAFEMCPPVLEWFYENATPNDSFVVSLSGAGYVHPYREFMSKTENPKQSWKQYLQITENYMDMLELDQLCLYSDAWIPFDRTRFDPITKKFVDNIDRLNMLIIGLGRDENALELGPNYLMGDQPVMISHVVTRWDKDNIGRDQRNNTWLAEDIISNTPKHRPAFITVHVLSWSYFPSDLVDVMDKLSDEYVAVSPAHLRQLYLQSQKNDHECQSKKEKP